MDNELQVADGRIDVWLAFPDEIHDPTLLAQFSALLSEDEARKNAAFHFASDRKSHLVTRALIRTVLSRYAPVQPCDWNFARNPYGKPAISNVGPETSRISFNVSHTRDLIALAVTREACIGVDVEHIDAHPELAALAGDVLAPDELSAFQQLPHQMQQRAFLRRWTLKESYVKATGAGLSLSFPKFSIGHVRPCRRALRADAGVDDAVEMWAFWQYEVTTTHLLALCVAQSGQPSHLCFRRVVPLRSDEALYVEALGCLDTHLP